MEVDPINRVARMSREEMLALGANYNTPEMHLDMFCSRIELWLTNIILQVKLNQGRNDIASQRAGALWQKRLDAVSGMAGDLLAYECAEFLAFDAELTPPTE